MAVKLIYNEEEIASLLNNETATLPTAGRVLEGDIYVEVKDMASSTTECTGRHVILVDELPTEHIEHDAIYQLTDKERLVDIVNVSKDGEYISVMSLNNLYTLPIFLYTIPTMRADDIHTSDMDGGPVHVYYIEDLQEVYVFTDQWKSLSEVSEIQYNGIIRNIHGLTAAGGDLPAGVYAIVQRSNEQYTYELDFHGIYLNNDGTIINYSEFLSALGESTVFCHYCETLPAHGIPNSVEQGYHYYYSHVNNAIYEYKNDAWASTGMTIISNINDLTNTGTVSALVGYKFKKYTNPKHILIASTPGYYNVENAASFIIAELDYQEKTLTITENTIDPISITPDENYAGLSSVSLSVNVPGEVLEEYDGTVLFLISFTIAGTEYQALEGMTWNAWVNSEYNTGAFLNSNADGAVIKGSECINGDLNLQNKIIEANTAYTLSTYSHSGGSND